jgi:hypothetical protein
VCRPGRSVTLRRVLNDVNGDVYGIPVWIAVILAVCVLIAAGFAFASLLGRLFDD